MSVHDPVADLALADAASRRLAGRARWAQRYYVLYAAYWFAAVFLFGFVFPSTIGSHGGVVGIFVLFGMIFVVDLWADRKGVVVLGSRRLRGIWIVTTLPLYLAALFLGLNVLDGDLAFWTGAAVVVAIPSLVAAVVTGRAAGPR